MPPPLPIVDIHFWKCYFKDGASFQTAKLFSVEVDYYVEPYPCPYSYPYPYPYPYPP